MTQTIEYYVDSFVVFSVMSALRPLDECAAGTARAHLDSSVEIIAGRCRYDPEAATITPFSPDEVATAITPRRSEVDTAVMFELRATDDRTSIDFHDAPQRPEVIADWALYRHALRALSDIADPIDMIRQWPERPDGIDPITALRARLT